jgi:subtilisin family serine protease
MKTLLATAIAAVSITASSAFALDTNMALTTPYKSYFKVYEPIHGKWLRPSKVGYNSAHLAQGEAILREEGFSELKIQEWKLAAFSWNTNFHFDEDGENTYADLKAAAYSKWWNDKASVYNIDSTAVFDHYYDDVAYARSIGIDGSGVTIGQVDWFTGKQGSHGLNTSTTTLDIASGVNLKKFDNNTWATTTNTIKAFQDDSVDVVSVISHGKTAANREGLARHITKAVKANRKLAVISAGNKGATSSTKTSLTNVYAFPLTGDLTVNNGILNYERDEDNLSIVVGALHNGKIAGYSNKAGIFAADFLTAEAEVYGKYSGTSNAAPVVAGAAALVMQKFNSTAAQTKSILLVSATDLGAKGVDTVYGHGALNIKGALSPVGGLN